MIKKIINLVSSWSSKLDLTKNETVLAEMFQLNKISDKKSNVILVQNVANSYYFGLFGLIVTKLKESHPIEVHQYSMHSLVVCQTSSFRHFINAYFENKKIVIKWNSLFNRFCDNVGYSSSGMQSPIQDILDVTRSYLVWKKLRNNEDLIQLNIKKIPVGTLIADSYLRFKPALTIKIRDKYLWLIIWQAHRDIRRSINYFAKYNPTVYLTSYSTYIQHGIAARVALYSGVRVYSFGNYQEFAKNLTLKDWFHVKYHHNYKHNFSKLNNQNDKLSLANAALSKRIDGEIDSATAYMKVSSYRKYKGKMPNVNGKIGIFLHNFFDAPHPYKWMLFSDFWEWICFTIEFLQKNEIPFFIKPHPNQLDLSDGALNQLLELYPSVLMIPSDVSNKQLVESGMVTCVTIYGTIAHEMAYLGIPTISTGDNPHVDFDFCKVAKSKGEYEKLLLNCNKTKFNQLEMKKEAQIFYYMHNLNVSQEELDLNAVLNKYRNIVFSNNSQSSELLEALKAIEKNPVFNRFLNTLNISN